MVIYGGLPKQKNYVNQRFALWTTVAATIDAQETYKRLDSAGIDLGKKGEGIKKLG